MTWTRQMLELLDERDPVVRARRQTDLILRYQQRIVELTRQRKVAIEEAHADQDLQYSDIASKIGVTKSRVSQIRQAGPNEQRVFFGVGPVTMVFTKDELPAERRQVDRVAFADDRPGMRPEIEFTLAAAKLLKTYDLAHSTRNLPLDADQLPKGDLLVASYTGLAPAIDELVPDDLRTKVEREQALIEDDGPLGEGAARGAFFIFRKLDGPRTVCILGGPTNLAPLSAAVSLDQLLPSFRFRERDTVSVVLRYEYRAGQFDITEATPD